MMGCEEMLKQQLWINAWYDTYDDILTDDEDYDLVEFYDEGEDDCE